MKVLHVSPSFFPAGHYGGPTHSSYHLCNELVKIPGLELRVLTTDSDGPSRIAVESIPTRLPAGYEVYYCRRWFGADIAPGLFRRLYSMIKWADVVHLTAVYSPPTIPVLFLCSVMNRPVVWSTRGALQRWQGSTRTGIKRVWEKCCNWLCSPGQVVLHVTSEEEKAESLKRIPNGQAAVIPNGVEWPQKNGFPPSPVGDQLRLLYLGRLHPIKGIENLLRALPALKANVQLAICGEGEPSYFEELRSLTRELGLDARVTFFGHVEGQAKEQQFRDADLCVVPSFKENFCLVVAEALARGIPVLASQGTPWQRLVEMQCGLWVGNRVEDLSKAIDLAATLPLPEMGARGRAWVTQEFGWQSIAQQMAAQYQSLTACSTSRVAARVY